MGVRGARRLKQLHVKTNSYNLVGTAQTVDGISDGVFWQLHKAQTKYRQAKSTRDGPFMMLKSLNWLESHSLMGRFSADGIF